MKDPVIYHECPQSRFGTQNDEQESKKLLDEIIRGGR
jgi:hypothetical protein